MKTKIKTVETQTETGGFSSTKTETGCKSRAQTISLCTLDNYGGGGARGVVKSL